MGRKTEKCWPHQNPSQLILSSLGCYFLSSLCVLGNRYMRKWLSSTGKCSKTWRQLPPCIMKETLDILGYRPDHLCHQLWWGICSASGPGALLTPLHHHQSTWEERSIGTPWNIVLGQETENCFLSLKEIGIENISHFNILFMVCLVQIIQRIKRIGEVSWAQECS